LSQITPKLSQTVDQEYTKKESFTAFDPQSAVHGLVIVVFRRGAVWISAA